MNKKLSLTLLAFFGASLANADLFYTSNFDAPTYSAATIAGQDGWYVGTSSDTATQSVTAGVGRDGSQGLRITNEAFTSYYSVGRALPTEVNTFYPFSVSVDLYMDESTAATRTYELALTSTTTGNLATSTVLYGINIGGDGKIRASNNWSTLGGTNGQRVTAAAGTYKSRWLTLTLAVDANRVGTATISGLGGATPSYSWPSSPIGADGAGWKNITGVNLIADHTGAFGGVGSGTFDNFVVATPVPEPATMAALGLGLAALVRRRRKN